MFSNPIASASGGLVFPSIHSPDYDPGVEGWTINRDGTAEFSDMVVRGVLTIENSGEGIFVYAGTPALGNLIASVASTNGTDPYGNLYPEGVAGENKGGFTARGDNSGTNYAIVAVPASNEPIVIMNSDNTVFQDGYFQALQDGTTPYTGKLTILAPAPLGKNSGSIEVLSEQSDSSAGPVAKIHADALVDGRLRPANTKLATGSVSNSTAETLIGQCTNVILANEATLGSSYGFSVKGTCDHNAVANTLRIRAYIGSINAANRVFDTGNIAVPASAATGLQWAFDGTFTVTSIGASGTQDSMGYYGDRIRATNTAINSGFAGQSIDTTAGGQSLLVTAQWTTGAVANVCRTSGGAAWQITH